MDKGKGMDEGKGTGKGMSKCNGMVNTWVRVRVGYGYG